MVLGSATPAMESFYNAQTENTRISDRPERSAGRPREARLIDMREVFKQIGKGCRLSRRASRGDQSDLHPRRTGHNVAQSPRVFAVRPLPHVRRDPESARIAILRSHSTAPQAGWSATTVTTANNRRVSVPIASSEFLYFVGEGTENIADQLAKKFPAVRIARVDRDTMADKGEIDDVLLKFAAGGLDMLVGTQMIAKGHDFPNVTLVGVISVDIGLGLPDLRSAERTFQLITQVAGRAGRGKQAGKVLIQTYYPEHYALRHAREQDYEGFYREEIKFRERSGYPPFFVLASIMIKHRDNSYASKNANILRRSLDDANSARNVRVLGPAPASLSRLKNEYRVQIIVKAASRRSLRETLDIALADAEERGSDLRTVNVEIDPVNLM